MLSLSGLDQSDLCWIRRLLRALGRHLGGSLSKSHLIAARQELLSHRIFRVVPRTCFVRAEMAQSLTKLWSGEYQ